MIQAAVRPREADLHAQTTYHWIQNCPKRFRAVLKIHVLDTMYKNDYTVNILKSPIQISWIGTVFYSLSVFV